MFKFNQSTEQAQFILTFRQFSAQAGWLEGHQTKEGSVDEAAKSEQGTDERNLEVLAPSLISTQKHTSGLTALTEKQLASRAGHLEILHGGKKDSKAQDSAMKHAQKIKK